MTTRERAVPTGSQTVGPYFRIGLEYLIERAGSGDGNTIESDTNTIEIRGKVLDRDGATVPDAMLEFWSAAASTSAAPAGNGHPVSFRRSATDVDGNFSVTIARPASLPPALPPQEHDQSHAPHFLVLVFARGLLRHLITRVYFEDESGNAADPVLRQVPAERRGTLVARLDQPDRPKTTSYRWDVVLQGQDETVFFAW